MKRRTFWISASLLTTAIVLLAGFWLLCKPCITNTTANINTNYPSSIDTGQIGSSILGSATNNSIRINTLAEKGMSVFVNYGIKTGSYDNKTDTITSQSGEPIATNITGLQSNTKLQRV
jgi:hypothetical protein